MKKIWEKLTKRVIPYINIEYIELIWFTSLVIWGLSVLLLAIFKAVYLTILISIINGLFFIPFLIVEQIKSETGKSFHEIVDNFVNKIKKLMYKEKTKKRIVTKPIDIMEDNHEELDNYLIDRNIIRDYKEIAKEKSKYVSLLELIEKYKVLESKVNKKTYDSIPTLDYHEVDNIGGYTYMKK